MSTYSSTTFNFNPISSPVITTGTYTVPTGKYAMGYVYFNETNSGTTLRSILLNGYVILKDLNTIIGASSTQVPMSALVYYNGQTAPIPAGSLYEGNPAGVSENGAQLSGAWNTGATYTNAYAYNMQTPNRLFVILKEGDQLTGSGKYCLNLYSYNKSAIPIVDFFDYSPISTAVASSAYTVPSGKYARVLQYFLPQTYSPGSIADYPNVNKLYLNGQNMYFINNHVAYYYYSYTDKYLGTFNYDALKKVKGFEPPKPIEYFAKAGDIISGDGDWRAIISLYNIPT
jgi:hypothetical protein